jgi:transcriptional regulator MraZ
LKPLRGQYEHSLDAKNRLSIPARHRHAFTDGVVLSKDPAQCITVWAPESHDSIIERALGGLNPFGSEYRTLIRFHEGNSVEIDLDASNRITLPSRLLEYAGIEKEVAVIGALDHLELWPLDRWNESQDDLEAEVREMTERLGNPS